MISEYKMGIIRLAKRTLVYGTIGTIISFPVIYNQGHYEGYSMGFREGVAIGREHSIEQFSDKKYFVNNPENKERYVIDFKKNTIDKYSELEDKLLDEIFSRGGYNE